MADQGLTCRDTRNGLGPTGHAVELAEAGVQDREEGTVGWPTGPPNGGALFVHSSGH